MRTRESVVKSISELEVNARWAEGKERRRAEKEAKKLQEFRRILDLPNAEQVLLRDLERLERLVKVTDDRWFDSGRHYQIPNNPNASLGQRKAHHHAQYGYGAAKKKIKLIKELLND